MSRGRHLGTVQPADTVVAIARSGESVNNNKA